MNAEEGTFPDRIESGNGGERVDIPRKPDDVGGKEEDRPHPSLLPQEKESLFPRLAKVDAPILR
jgi:hypothetical protein